MHSFVKNLDQWSFRNSWLELLLLLTKTEKEVRCGILIHSFVFLELKAMNNFCARPKIVSCSRLLKRIEKCWIQQY